MGTRELQWSRSFFTVRFMVEGRDNGLKAEDATIPTAESKHDIQPGEEKRDCYTTSLKGEGQGHSYIERGVGLTSKLRWRRGHADATWL